MPGSLATRMSSIGDVVYGERRVSGGGWCVWSGILWTHLLLHLLMFFKNKNNGKVAETDGLGDDGHSMMMRQLDLLLLISSMLSLLFLYGGVLCWHPSCYPPATRPGRGVEGLQGQGAFHKYLHLVMGDLELVCMISPFEIHLWGILPVVSPLT